MHETWCDFNINRKKQHVRLHNETLDALWDSDCSKLYCICVLNTIGSLRRKQWTKTLEERHSSHTHMSTQIHTLAQRHTCASIDLAWSELFHVCSRDFIAGYLSGAPCLLDQAGLPTHSHLSEHSSDEITHTGISAGFFCACVLMWYSLNAAIERGQMSLCVSVWMWVWLKKWNGGLIWNVMLVYYYIPSEFSGIIPVTGANANDYIHCNMHSFSLINTFNLHTRNSLYLITLQNHLLNRPNILRHKKIRACLLIKDTDKSNTFWIPCDWL